MIETVCVFCGSRNGVEAGYRADAERLGALLAERRMTLVYGGGDIGLMGACADAALERNGVVRGFIPERLLQREVGHRGLAELVITENMFDRKARMIDASDAFVVLAGGLGTLDEFFEVLTLKQLGYHAKPILLVSHKGQWAPLRDLIRAVVNQGFADPTILDLYEETDSVEDAVAALAAVQAAA